jgi:hypothetical protein
MSQTRDMDYETNNVGYDCQYPEGGIKCKNYEVCDAVLPDWWWDCKECYLCTNCDIHFGTWTTNTGFGNDGKGILEFIDNYECAICMETKRCVSQPKCNHFVCIDCFKRCYYGDESGRPDFPYPEIEEEYDDDQDNPKWREYPLIAIYNQEWNAWDDNRMEKYEREKNLRCCPLCRK